MAEALRDAGVRCAVVESSLDELTLHGRGPVDALQGDARQLPFRAGTFDIVHSSNVIEHLDRWRSMLEEMARVLRPGGGVGYLSFSPWLSPWGGHETSPWHYFGGYYAARRYESRYGTKPKNNFGSSLFRLYVGTVLRWFDQRQDIEVLWVGARYLPDWMHWIVRVPAAREVLSWNVAIVFRKVHP
jgi:ubiquinone/menaquinone biosynthesis C-methylase UbiE